MLRNTARFAVLAFAIASLATATSYAEPKTPSTGDTKAELKKPAKEGAAGLSNKTAPSRVEAPVPGGYDERPRARHASEFGENRAQQITYKDAAGKEVTRTFSSEKTDAGISFKETATPGGPAVTGATDDAKVQDWIYRSIGFRPVPPQAVERMNQAAKEKNGGVPDRFAKGPDGNYYIFARMQADLTPEAHKPGPGGEKVVSVKSLELKDGKWVDVPKFTLRPRGEGAAMDTKGAMKHGEKKVDQTKKDAKATAKAIEADVKDANPTAPKKAPK